MAAAFAVVVATYAVGSVMGDRSSSFFSSPMSAWPNQTPPQTEGSSSSLTEHRKTGANSSQTVRHTRVAEESPGSAEVAQAEDLIQKRDYAAAEALLERAVVSDPSNYVAWFDLGFAENGLGKTDDSIAAYRKSVAAKADVFESNLNLGIQLAKGGQPDAEQFLRAATVLTPTGHVSEGRERAWLSLAHLLESEKPDEALAAYKQAAALQAKDPEPHLAAGQLFEKQGKFSDAESQYKQALALDHSSQALTALANIYMRGRRFPEATQPDEAAPHIQLGRVLAAEGKNNAAVAELQAGAKLAPADISVQHDLGDLYLSLGKNDQAEAIYRALVAGRPNDAELHHALGQCLLREKKFSEAQRELLAAVKLKPDLGEAYGDLAFAAGENKDYALVIKALDARKQFLPEIPITYFFRATAYDNLKDMKKAAANYHLFLNTANGKYPQEEWQAKHRLIAIEPKK